MCIVEEKAKTIAEKIVTVVNAVCIDHSESSLLLALMCNALGECVWIFPGGKVNPGETLKDALRRELYEEIAEATFLLEGEFHQKTFSGKTPFSKKSIEVHICEVSCVGGRDMEPSHEIDALYWIYPWQADLILNEGVFDDERGHLYPVSAVTMEILEYLLEKGGGITFMM